MKYRLVPMDFKIGTQGAFGTTTTQYGCAIHEEQGTLIATALAQTRREAKRRAAVIRDALLHDDAIRARAELADLRRRAQGVDVEAVVRERDELRKRCEDLVLIANTWALSDEDGNPWGLRVTDNKLVLVDEDGDIVLDRDEHTGLPILNDAARRALARETGAKP